MVVKISWEPKYWDCKQKEFPGNVKFTAKFGGWVSVDLREAMRKSSGVARWVEENMEKKVKQGLKSREFKSILPAGIEVEFSVVGMNYEEVDFIIKIDLNRPTGEMMNGVSKVACYLNQMVSDFQREINKEFEILQGVSQSIYCKT